jgi:subtilase family serine protease
VLPKNRHRSSSAPRAKTRARALAAESLEGRSLLSTAPLDAPAAAVAVEVSSYPAAHRHAHPQVSAHPVAAPHVRAMGRSGARVTPLSTPAGTPYTPAQVRKAYGFGALAQTGAGQTIAIVDAYDDPNIAHDLAVFDSHFGIAAPPSLTKVNEYGSTTSLPAANSGWADEIALDVEWDHAIAPGAKIVLVEANSTNLDDLLTGVDTAVKLGARQVSMSFGAGDFSSEPSYDNQFNRPGVSFFASSGDGGAGVNYPAASPYVTAVGGTSFTIDATTGARISETAWSGSGGGVSSYESRPSYQAPFLSGTHRGSPDVSYDADPHTGVYVYNSYSGGSWYSLGGTSAGAPQWAGLAALANQGRVAAGKSTLGTSSTLNATLYALAGGSSVYTNARGDFFDVTTGSSGNAAHAGYDLATGLGSPVANKLIPDLINS